MKKELVAKMGRPKRALEPAMYVAVTKTCPFCSSTNAEYKFLNNKNIQQPRYKCLGCNKYFTHNPASRRKKHPRGYAKIAVAFAELLPNTTDVPCPNPSCGNIGAYKFLYFNNGNVGQPRYKCEACKTSFTYGGRRSPNRNRSAQAVRIPEHPTQQMLERIGSDLLPNADSPSIVELMESRDVPETEAESNLDEINWAELQDIGSPSFPEIMQSRDNMKQASEQTSKDNNPVEHLRNIDSPSFTDMWKLLDAPEEANDQTPEEIKLAEMSDIARSTFMGMVRLSDVPEEASEEILDETNPVELQDIDSSSFTEMMELFDVPDEPSEPIPDENNPVEYLLDIDSPNFMAMLQLPADPMEWGIQ